MIVWAIISPRQVDPEHTPRHYFCRISRLTFTASGGVNCAAGGFVCRIERLLALDQDRSSFLLSRFRRIRLDVVLLLLLAKAKGARVNDKILDFAASDKRDVPATFSALRLAFICDDFCEADGVSQMLTTAVPPRDVAPRLGWASAYVRDCIIGICQIVSEGS